MNTNDLKGKAISAQKILNRDTSPYARAKRLISLPFRFPLRATRMDLAILRLTVIDSFYGTNMSKRYYGIDDIADAICNLGDTDEIIGSRFLQFIGFPAVDDTEIKSLFTRRYGLTKKASEAGRAPSLVSKYAYFLTGYQFPIYDSLAVKTFNLLVRCCPFLQLSRIPNESPISFFHEIRNLNRQFEDFDLLDNLLWLTGKVHEGNLSLVLGRAEFMALSGIISLPLNASSLYDSIQYNPSMQKILGLDLCKFAEFAFSLA